MAEPVHRPAILRLSGRTLDIRDLNEVIALLERHHCNKASYHRLGLCLLLSHNTLGSIEQEHRGQVDRCLTECLASWLRKADGVENPTINTLIAALKGIGENAVADGIDEERQSDIVAIPRNEMSDRPLTSEGHAVQLDTVNPGVRDLEFIIDEVPELQEIAIKLQGKYDSLALAVKKSLEIHCIDVEDAKFLIKECLRRKAHVVSGLMSFINILEKVIGFESLFDFLIKYDFIGYINYKLLKKLSELIKDDDEIIRLFFKYEEEYAKLLSAASFQDLIPLFHKQSDLSPTAPLGLPYVSFHLERPWLLTNVYTWISTFGQFSWSYYAFLKQLRENCVIITYAMLPCVLDDVIRDLTNPVILRKLKTEGVTVIELPQQEIEPQLEDTTKKDLISTLKRNEVVTIGKEVIIKSSSLGRELIRSIESHTKPEEVIGLLEAGADLNATEYTSDCDTALTRAIEKDNIDIIKFLLEKGANPNIASNARKKRTPLFNAVKSGSIEAINILLTNGARTDVSKDGKTLLHYAGRSGKVEMLEFWIKRGDYDVNVKDKRNRTPLFNAVKSGSIEAVHILLTNGARADVISKDGVTLLHCAGKSGKVEMLEFWIRRGDYDVNVKDKRKRTPLFNAVKSGSIEAVNILLTNGAKTDVVDKDCETLLHCASEFSKIEMLKFWIKRGDYDINVLNKKNRPPFFNAVKSGSIEAVDILLINGARTDIVDEDGVTLLHCAGESGKVEMLEFWINRGEYDVNAKDKSNRTPLFTAVKSGSIEVVDVLLTNGSRTDVVDKCCTTPLHFASETGNGNIIKLLITKGNADVNAIDENNRTPLFNAVKSGSIEAVDILLTNGARTDAVSQDGETLLHSAGKSGNVEMLEFWRGDYDVNIKDKRKRTPLFNAVNSGSIEAVDILLSNGARTDVVDKYDGTPLHYAASEAGNGNIIELLITKGNADVNAVDKRKVTPLFNAVKSGSFEAVDILFTNGARTDVVSKDSETLLHCAGESGKVEMLEFFIEKGEYDVNVKNEENKTPLFNAVKSGSIEAVDILLTNGARTDVVSKVHFLDDSGTPLHCASESGNAKIIQLLITKGNADVNAVDENDRTPLFNAVKSGSIEAVDILLTNGARTDVVSKDILWDDSSTPLHCASESGNAEIIELLITKGNADVNAVDENDRTPLFNAVKSGSIEAVDILLTNGARTDVVSKDILWDDSGTPLHCASESGNAEIIELLITKGNADVNAVDENGKTPLFNAAKKGSIGAVDILLTNGARTDVVSKDILWDDGSTPLHCAGESGNAKIIELLITKGNADVNAMDERNRTPLFNAVESGSIEAVDILLTNGARTDVVSKDGKTLLHCAGASGKVEMLKFWIKKGDHNVNVKDKRNKTPLFDAVKSGSVEAVDILLTNGARTNVVSKVHFWDGGSTPLHCASETGNAKIIELLITKGNADVNAVDKDNRTPLFNAVKSGSIEAVDILLTNGARTDVVDKDGETLLHCAGKSGKVEMLEFWIKRGNYDVNVKNKKKRTPLFDAVKSGSIESVDILLTNGARTDIVSKAQFLDDGSTPLHCASETGNAKIITLLITKGSADVNAVDEDDRTPLFNAVKSGSIEAANILLTNGARTDAVNTDGKTLLHCAGESGEVEMLEFWIKRGDYDMNVKDNDNRTPLFHAIESGSIEAVDILLTNGATTDVVSKTHLLADSSTPLHCASESGNTKIIELLITKGNADVNVLNESSRTPLFNAVKSGNMEAVNILLTNGARTDVVSKDGETLLHCAGESGKVEMLEFWIKKGNYNVNTLDKRNRTPLFNLLENYSISIEAVDILLTNGARADVVDTYKRSTPLHCASRTGNASIIKLLITNGKADVNAVDKNNRTPLLNAVKCDSIEAVDVLLTNGARTDVVSKATLLDDGNTPLHCASESGNVKIIELLITKGNADVNAVDENDRTPLFNAVKSGSIEAVDILLTNGARTDVLDDGSTPLHCASDSGNDKFIELLITKGKADVNAVDKDNKTPLFNAVKSGSIEAVDILLTNGARTDVVNTDDGSTPLHCASKSGNAKIIELLITKGNPDVNAVDENDITPLFKAIESGSIEAVDILLSNGARTDVVNTDDGSTPLHCASESGNAKIIQLLITKGKADANAVDEDDKTPLFNAVMSGSNEAVNILLTHGAKTDVVDTDDGSTPLHCASESGNAKIIELLITKGNADVNAVDEDDVTPLFKAIESGSIEAVDILLTNEARTDVVNTDDGSTPLHCASESGNSEVIELLITKGNADVNAVDEDGRVPLFNAVKSGSIEAVDILLTNGARADVVGDGSTPLHCASETGNAKLIKLLVTKGKADVNAVDRSWERTPLFNAVKSGSIEAVDILLTNGARTDIVDEDGQTLLHCASESGKVEMLEFWIKREDFDVNVLDQSNRTPLFKALEKHYKRSISIKAVDILLTNGARTDVVDKYDDSTPLHCASETGNSKIINLLITKGKADVNAVDEYNKTPLFNAVESGSIKAVDILLTNGARTDVLSKDGETLLQYAGKSGKVEMLEFWIRRGDHDVNAFDKNNRTPLFDAVESNSVKAVDILLSHGARTDVAEKWGDTPLHIATARNKTEIIKVLITKGNADVNALDEEKRTPLFNAVEKGSIEVVDILLANGARTDVVDKDGETLLHCAGESGEVKMLEFWIKRGDYDVNVKNKKKRTPLFNAVESGSIEAVEILLTNGARTDIVDKDGETLLQCAGESGEVKMLEFWISKVINKTNTVHSGPSQTHSPHTQHSDVTALSVNASSAPAKSHSPMNSLETLMKEFEGKVTREQAAAIYKSSGFNFDASMKCLKEGPTLESILLMLNQKMGSVESVFITVRTNEMWHDVLHHYKSGTVNFGKRLFVKLSDAPAIDAGGVRRQVYSTVYNEFLCNKHIELFTGPSHSLSPACTAEARSSGLFKILGSMVGHSIWQDGIGFPFFSLTNYTYIVEGEEKALQVCSDSDIDAGVAEVISKLRDIKTEDDGKEVMKDESILDIISRCGIKMIPNPSTKYIIVQDIITYEALFKHSKLLDQFVEGLKATSLYPLLRAFPTLFQPLFTFTELTSEEVQKSLIFPNEKSFIAQESIILRYLKKYIDECDSEGLKEFALSITGRISVLPKSIGIKFEADRMGTIATHSCSGEIFFPCRFEGDYEMFCSALKSVLSHDFNTY